MYYTNERNVQLLISMMKSNNVRKVIASPGTTNISFVMSIQNDDFFTLYSAADERSAAYMACGMSAESGECVAITCTGATASRNYLPGLTEAYYRNLKILALTATHHHVMIGQNIPQVIDRTRIQKDVAKVSLSLPIINSENDELECVYNLNNGFYELLNNGGGPVHFNIEISGERRFETRELPTVRKIKRVSENSKFPAIDEKSVCIYIGSYNNWSEELVNGIEEFCRKYNAVVLYDHSSNYKGDYGILGSLVCCQEKYVAECTKIDLLIHIGNVSAAYLNLWPRRVWRIDEDGKIRDTYRKLEHIFEMNEKSFFDYYNYKKKSESDCNYYRQWRTELNNLFEKIPELPFSNIWLAKNTVTMLPKNSSIHFGILNSFRSWNFFDYDKTVSGFVNSGGFGIDGNVSSLIGASLCNPNKIFVGIVGDLSFFYDMNSLGNHNVGNNIRLLLVNNGVGTEFKNYSHPASAYGDLANEYIAAAGHYGNKSKALVKHYAEDLGFRYISASNKDEYKQHVKEFLADGQERSVIFEVFTESEDESEALRTMCNLETSFVENGKQIVKGILGNNRVDKLKNILKKN